MHWEYWYFDLHFFCGVSKDTLYEPNNYFVSFATIESGVGTWRHWDRLKLLPDFTTRHSKEVVLVSVCCCFLWYLVVVCCGAFFVVVLGAFRLVLWTPLWVKRSWTLYFSSVYNICDVRRCMFTLPKLKPTYSKNIWNLNKFCWAK